MAEFPMGIDTFGDVTVDADGNHLTQAEVIRNVVDEAVLAESVGLDAFSVGEHHRDDFAVTAPEVVLAAIATRTERITLGSAVTVLSSDDPVRIYERFATLDAVSNGRAEITVGRGSFTESFPLFGYALADYAKLFEEKLELLAQLQMELPVTWSGTVRAALKNQQVYPTTANSLPIWVGVGGSPESVVRTARYQLPMMLAIIGGAPARFGPFVSLYKQLLTEMGVSELPVGVHSPGFVADSNREARDLLYPHHKVMRDRIGEERGWGPTSRDEFERDVEEGALFVGDPEFVANKIIDAVETLGVQRFDMKYSNGPLPYELAMRSIELYGKEVLPRVKKALAG